MSKRTYQDAFDLLCGDKIGSGIHRDVFECRLRRDLVVKVEIDSDWRNFANVHEHRVWSDLEHAPAYSKWLAPCECLSPDGRISLQTRVRIANEDDRMPEKLPAFLTDFKRSNFGWLDGRFVAVDYSMAISNHSARMRTVRW